MKLSDDLIKSAQTLAAEVEAGEFGEEPADARLRMRQLSLMLAAWSDQAATIERHSAQCDRELLDLCLAMRARRAPAIRHVFDWLVVLVIAANLFRLF